MRGALAARGVRAAVVLLAAAAAGLRWARGLAARARGRVGGWVGGGGAGGRGGAGGGAGGGRAPDGLQTAAVVLVSPSEAAASSAAGCAALAGAVAFCAGAGARGIWLYEPGGALKERGFQEGFRKALRSQTGGGASVCCLQGGRALPPEGASSSERGRPVVYLASAEDGTEPAAEAAALLAQAACTGGLMGGGEPGLAVEQRVNRAIGHTCGPQACEEVDLILVVGDVLTLAGFPPWLTRSSEIHHLGGLSELSERKLKRTLARYYGTAQRLGA